MLQHTLKMGLRRLGFDLRRMKNVPASTFLGLHRLPIDCVVDVGANVGQFARYAREMFPQSKIYCLEPLPSAAAQLRRSAMASGDQNLIVHEIALGEHVGVADLIEHLDHSASSSFLQNSARANEMFPQTTRQTTRQVQMDTLDRWIARENVSVGPRTLLKLDVQGFESQVLRGGRAALQGLGVCMVEVTPIPLYEQQSTFVDIVNLLAEGGVHYLGNLEQFHDDAGLPVYMDALFVRPSALAP
jgi:FkbM family methyltransferase